MPLSVCSSVRPASSRFTQPCSSPPTAARPRKMTYQLWTKWSRASALCSMSVAMAACACDWLKPGVLNSAAQPSSSDLAPSRPRAFRYSWSTKASCAVRSGDAAVIANVFAIRSVRNGEGVDAGGIVEVECADARVDHGGTTVDRQSARDGADRLLLCIDGEPAEPRLPPVDRDGAGRCGLEVERVGSLRRR